MHLSPLTYPRVLFRWLDHVSPQMVHLPSNKNTLIKQLSTGEIMSICFLKECQVILLSPIITLVARVHSIEESLCSCENLYYYFKCSN